MQAIVLINSQQLKVGVGQKIIVNKIAAKPGERIEFDKVLFCGDGKNVQIGKPTIKNAKVVAEVLKQKRGPKVIVFKKRSKKGYKKTQGHRQYLTELVIKDINFSR